MGKLLRVNPRHSYHKKIFLFFFYISIWDNGCSPNLWGIISWCMEVKLLCWSAVCQLHLNKTEKTKKEKLLQAAIKAPSQRLVGWTQTGKPLKKKKNNYLYNKHTYICLSLNFTKGRKRKKRKESKSDPTLDNGARQHLSVEHIIFSFWHAHGKR